MKTALFKELAKQSNVNLIGDTGVDTTQANLHKLVEIAIQQAITLCNDVGLAIWAEEHQSNIGTTNTCVAVLKAHFGVE